MSAYCNQCAAKYRTGRGDLAWFRWPWQPKHAWALCEGCGKMVLVDTKGNRVETPRPPDGPRSGS